MDKELPFSPYRVYPEEDKNTKNNEAEEGNAYEINEEIES